MDELELTLFDVLRAVVRGEAAKLNNPEWVGKALEAIGRHERHDSTVPAAHDVPEPDVPPAPAPVPEGGGGL